MHSLFKPIVAVLCLVFALCFLAPNAVADEFVYTYTVTFFDPAVYGATFTTNPMAAITAQTTILAADLASFSLTGSIYQGRTFASLTLDWGPLSDLIDFADCPAWYVSCTIGYYDGYPESDFSTPGTYSNVALTGNTLTVTDVTATPEPSSLALMLSRWGRK